MATIKDAVQLLPESCREAFLETWRETNCVDIYDGDLKSYIDVLGFVIKIQATKIKLLELSGEQNVRN